MIVGESLFGAVNAALIVGFNRDAPLAVVRENCSLSPGIAFMGFVGLVALLYIWLFKRTREVRAGRI
jgi:hypothetical protein